MKETTWPAHGPLERQAIAGELTKVGVSLVVPGGDTAFATDEAVKAISNADGPLELAKAGLWIVPGLLLSSTRRADKVDGGLDASKGGLDWDAVVPTKGKYKGQSRPDHVRLHNVDDAGKPSHGVSFDDGVTVTDEAWARAQSLGLKPDATGTLKVPMGRQVGVLGGVEGSTAYVPLDAVTIKVVPGTNKLITAYPDL
jgi:hypothetical protein